MIEVAENYPWWKAIIGHPRLHLYIWWQIEFLPLLARIHPSVPP